MVKNRKEPKEIIEQLEFFVGDATETFVKWCVPSGRVDRLKCTAAFSLHSTDAVIVFASSLQIKRHQLAEIKISVVSAV